MWPAIARNRPRSRVRGHQSARRSVVYAAGLECRLNDRCVYAWMFFIPPLSSYIPAIPDARREQAGASFLQRAARSRSNIARVLVLMLVLIKPLQLAVQPILGATVALVGIALKLDRRVPDPVFLPQHMLKRGENRGALAGRQVVDLGVAGEGVHIVRDAPDVEIMHIL